MFQLGPRLKGAPVVWTVAFWGNSTLNPSWNSAASASVFAKARGGTNSKAGKSHSLAMSPLPGRVAPFFERQGVAGRVDPTSGLFHPALTVDEVTLMKRAVHETYAVSWAPDVLIAEEVRQGSLVPLPFRADWARLNYGAIRRADRPVTPALGMFLVEMRAVEKELSRSLASERVRRRPGRRGRTG
jgi:LysR substrate binding domain